MKLENRTIDVDGLSIRYLEIGATDTAAIPVILLHGASIGSSCEAFEEVMPSIAESGNRLLAYDQTGYGESDNPDDYRLSYRVGFVTKLLDAWGIDRAVLVAHSQAGAISFQVAAQHPERVAGVVIACTGSLLPPTDTPASGGAPTAPHEAAASPGDPTMEDTLKLMRADLFHKDLATPEAVARRHRLSVGKNVVAATGRSSAREAVPSTAEMWTAFDASSVPVTLMWGDHDRANAGERALAFKEQRPDLSIAVVKDSAHMLMTDAPDVFVSAVRSFLAELA
jgi:haloalkane dehalogenase